VQWYLRRANRQLLSIYCISRYIQNNRRPLHRSIYIIWFIINKLAFPVWEKFSLLQKKVIISIMWKIISYLPSFQDNRLHLKRIKQKICLFSLYSTFFLFIKLIFNQILCPFIQISWTKKTFDVDLRFYNEKQSTHGVVYHLSFTSSLFFKMLFSYFFPLITYHMNYQISVDSHDRSNTFYSSFSSYSTRRHIHGNEHMGRRYLFAMFTPTF